MARKKLELEVRLDAKKAKQDQKALESDVKNSAAKIAKSYEPANKKIIGFSQSLKKTAKEGEKTANSLKSKFSEFSEKARVGAEKAGAALVSAFKKGGVAVAALSVAVVGLKKTLEELTTIQSEEARNKIFGVSIEQAKEFNKALGGALSQRQALQEVAKLKSAGFSEEEVQSISKMVRPLEVMGLLSKEAALEIARTGNVSEDVLNSFGLSAQKVDYELNNVVMSSGQVPKQLDRAKVVMRLIQAQAEKYRGTWEKIGTTSPIDRLFARLKDLKDTVFKAFAEAVEKNAKTFDDMANSVPNIAKGIVDATVKIKDFGKAIKEEITENPFVKNVGKAIKEAFTFQLDFGKSRKGSLFGLGEEMIKQKVQEDIKKISQATAQAVKKETAKNRKARKPKGISLEAQEAQADLMGKQSEFRNQMRNFLQFYLNNISTMGGALSGIISASKDLPEQLRILTTNKDAVKAMKATKGLTEEQIILKLKEEKLNEKQVKAVLLLKQIEKAGSFDLEEKIRNQQTVTKELRAQALTSEHLAQLASFEKQSKDLDIEITKSQRLLKLSILGIDLQRFELEKKQSKSTKSATKDFYQQQINALDILKKRFIEGDKAFSAQAKSQRDSIDLAQWRVQYEKDIIDPIVKQAEREKAILSIKRERMAIDSEISAIYGKHDDFQAKVVASLQKEDDLLQRIGELRVARMRAAQSSQIAIATGDKNEIAMARAKEQNLISQIKGVKGLLGAQQELTEALNNQAQPFGRFVQGFKSAFQTIQGGMRHLAQTFGEVWGNTLNTGLSGLQSFVSEYFKSIISMEKVDWGQKLGQGFLELLAGIAAKFGAVFASVGAGYIALGNIGQGVAAIAAAGGLFALAGVLSGLSSITDKSKKGGASKKGGGRSSPPPPAITAPPAPERKERETYVIINSAPFLGSPLEQGRKFAKWDKRNKRVLGTVLP